jgi:hypothetical protein
MSFVFSDAEMAEFRKMSAQINTEFAVLANTKYQQSKGQVRRKGDSEPISLQTLGLTASKPQSYATLDFGFDAQDMKEVQAQWDKARAQEKGVAADILNLAGQQYGRSMGATDVTATAGVHLQAGKEVVRGTAQLQAGAHGIDFHAQAEIGVGGIHRHVNVDISPSSCATGVKHFGQSTATGLQHGLKHGAHALGGAPHMLAADAHAVKSIAEILFHAVLGFFKG